MTKKYRVKRKSKGLKRRGVQEYAAVRTWFKCDVYPDRHPEDEHEIEEHYFTTSVKGRQISEQDVLDKHADKFPHHEVIDYEVGRTWNYQRDRYGRRI